MNDTYECSYVEVLELLKHIPKNEYQKIPKEKIEFYERNKDNNYKYIYEENYPQISLKTSAIIVNLYKEYIASLDEKKKIEEILALNRIKRENESKEMYNSNDIFINRKKKDKIEENSLIEYKETVFIKLKKFIYKLKKMIGR